MKKVCHIILAAGSGSRYGGNLPKQYCELQGRPLLMTTIDRISGYARRHGHSVLLVLSDDMLDLWHELCETHRFSSPATTGGGSTRFKSVKKALSHPLAAYADIVSIHDGARPLVSHSLIARVIDVKGDGNIPVVAVTDSLRHLDGNGLSTAVVRSDFAAVQTPQAFPGKLLREAYSRPWQPEFTDDASVMEAAGHTALTLVEGEQANIKVTRPGDIEHAEILMRLGQ